MSTPCSGAHRLAQKAPELLPALLLALGLAGCFGSSPAQPPASPAQQASQSRRVILMSLDGAGASMLWDLHQQGLLKEGGFERFFRDGEVAEGLIPVNPTLTSTSHISLATGLPPSATGIVGNQYHASGSPFTEKVSGFEAPIGTETLWEAVRRQGRRVGILTWPGADGQGERRIGDWGLIFSNGGNSEIGPVIITLERSDWKPASPDAASGTVASHSPLMSSRVALGPEEEGAPPPPALEIFAVDGTDDSQVNYDGVAVVTQPAGGARSVTAPLRAGEWGHVAWPRPEGTAFSWLKLFALAPDLSSGHLSMDGIYQTKAYPGDFAEALARGGLHWPGPPDSTSLAASWQGKPGIDLDTWSQQAERGTSFMSAALRLAAARMDWDLLMGYLPVIDQAGHRLLLREERQPGFSPQRRDDLARAYERVWREVDAELARLLAGLDLTRTTVVVVSDHGMTPVHTAIDPNAPLAELGLLAKAPADGGAAPRPTAYAVADGGAAHIYLDAGGNAADAADAAEGERLLSRIAARYADWKVEGTAPVEKVLTRREAAQEGLDHPNSGDLILFARMGYIFRGLPGGKPAAPAQVYGAHGYLNAHPEMRGIYMAIGAGVKPGHSGTVRATEVAPRVAAWLGIDPPNSETFTSDR